MAQGDQQQFCLRWNDFQTNMVSSFKHLRDEKSFTDVTLACDGQTCKAHKMVLSACSPYFKVGLCFNLIFNTARFGLSPENWIKYLRHIFFNTLSLN